MRRRRRHRALPRGRGRRGARLPRVGSGVPCPKRPRHPRPRRRSAGLRRGGSAHRQLQDISQRQQTFLKQLYNTLVETLSTGQDPSVKTQTYHMDQSNDVVYGMQPTQPTTPSQSVQEIDDQCVSSYMLEALKSTASAFTMTALEATNPVLRRVFSDSIPNIIEMAYEVFLYQNKHQYYQVPQLQQQDMQELANSFAPIQGGTMSH